MTTKRAKYISEFPCVYPTSSSNQPISKTVREKLILPIAMPTPKEMIEYEAVGVGVAPPRPPMPAKSANRKKAGQRKIPRQPDKISVLCKSDCLGSLT